MRKNLTVFKEVIFIHTVHQLLDMTLSDTGCGEGMSDLMFHVCLLCFDGASEQIEATPLSLRF